MLVNALSIALVVDRSSDDCQSCCWEFLIAGMPEGVFNEKLSMQMF